MPRNRWLPAVPTASSMYAVRGLREWTQRVGFLMDPPHDHWWTVQTEDELPAVVDHVVAVVRDAVLPQLQARLAGGEPPHRPIKEIGPVADCPAPTCAYPPVAWVEGADLGSLGDLIAANGGLSVGDDPGLGLGFAPAQRQLLDRARSVAVPRTQAWKVLHISRARLDSYADRIGAGAALTFLQLLAVDLLGTDDLLTPARWPEAAEVVSDWAARLPDADLDSALVVAEDAVAVMPLTAALTRDDPAFGASVVQPLMTAVQYLLQELSGARVV